MGWCERPAGNHGRQRVMVALLVAAGATVERQWLEHEGSRRRRDARSSRISALIGCRFAWTDTAAEKSLGWQLRGTRTSETRRERP